MVTSSEYINFVCERIKNFGNARSRKMFGEYVVYLNDKLIFTVCDNTVFVKKMPYIAELMKDAECGCPYDGAKEHYILDVEDSNLLKELIPILEKNMTEPSHKKKTILYQY